MRMTLLNGTMLCGMVSCDGDGKGFSFKFCTWNEYLMSRGVHATCNL